MSGTEESILKHIPDFEGESSGDLPTQTQTSQDDGSPGHSSAAPAQQVDSRGSGSDQRNQQTPQTIRRRHDGLIEQPNPTNPATRDLVDPVTGRVVAQGGIERRVFEEGQRHQRENAQLKQQLQTATQQLQATNEVSRVATELQIAPEQQVVALRVMSDFMRDPVKTLEMLVAEVKSKGYQIPFLEQGISQGMDLNAIQRMIDAKMAPLTQQQEMARRQQEEQANARRILDGFLSTHPEAEANLQTLAQMMQAQPGLTIHDAYVKMVTWAHSNQLDYTQPLEQQITALQQQQSNQPQQPQSFNRPLPNGRSAGNGQPTTQASQFNENTSWGDIIRHSMEETGYSLNR